MPNPRRAGGITRRCECRGTDGKLLGPACPQAGKKNHGALRLRLSIPPGEDGKRRAFQRNGYQRTKEADADLSRLTAILDLVKGDETDARIVGDYLADLSRTRAPIPEPAVVQRKLGVGVALDSKTTVGEYLDRWMARKKTRTTTNNAYRSHIRVHLKPRIGHIRLDRLSVAHLEAMFDAIADESDVIRAENEARREQAARCKWGRPGTPPASERPRLAAERARLAEMKPFRKTTGPATRQAIRRTLRAALNKAIAEGAITFNAASHVELTTAHRPKGLLWTDERVAYWRETGEVPSPVMVWTPAQLGAFLDAAEGHRLYAGYHLISHHGLRRGEGVGAAWSELSFERREIRVSREIVVDGWTPIETEPKTDGSVGVVKLDRETLKVLAAHRERQLAERDAWNVKAAADRAKGKDTADWADTGKILTAEDGSWLHPDVLSREFERIVQRAGLPPINLRDLRHGAAALVKAGGGDLHDAKVKLRHSTITLTSDTYMALFQEYEDDLAERAAAAVPRARKSPATVAVPSPGPAASQPATADDDSSVVARGTDNDGVFS